MNRTMFHAAFVVASLTVGGCLDGQAAAPESVDGSFEVRGGEGVDLNGRFVLQVLGPSYASKPMVVDLQGPGSVAADGISCAKEYRLEAWDHDAARRDGKGVRLHGSAPLDCSKDGGVLATVTVAAL